MKRDLAGLGSHHQSAHFDKITEIKHLIKEIQACFQFVDPKEQLNLAGTILDVRKGQLTLGAQRTDTASQGGMHFTSLFFSSVKLGNGLGVGVSPLCTG